MRDRTVWLTGRRRHHASLSMMVVALLPLIAAGVSAAEADDAGNSLPGRPPIERPAGNPASAGGMWLSMGVLSGSTQPSARLADYQWDTRPRVAWGAQALVGHGRFATGLRLWRTSATQQIDVSGAASPIVRSTSLELVGHGRIWAAWGMNLLATASAGLLHLGYDPDQVTINSGGSGPIVVGLPPINEWTGGGGVALERPLSSRWALGLDVDYGIFGLDTAHRIGNVIVNGRKSFGEWNARLELARLFRRR